MSLRPDPRGWGLDVAASVLDQGFYSGANFVLAIALARACSPEEYGAYASSYAVVLVLTGLSASVLGEPLSVFGARESSAALAERVAALVVCHVPLAVVASASLALAAAIAPGLLRDGLLAAALATLLVPLHWLARSACQAARRPRAAALGSALYGLLLLGLTFALASGQRLTAASALVAMAVASGLAAFALLRGFPRPAGPLRLEAIAREHWGYGRLILGASAVSAVAGGLYVPFVSSLFGLAAAGQIRAGQNLLTPLQLTLTAVAAFALPAASRRIAREGIGPLRARATRLGLATLVVVAVYGVVVSSAAPWLYAWLYHDAYLDGAWVVPGLALGALATAAAQLLGIAARAVLDPAAVMWGKLVGAVTFLGGLVALRHVGLAGAIAAQVLAALAEAVAIGARLHRQAATAPPTLVRDPGVR